jgi:tetratricopeptide (TPR) repeat protein
LTLTALNSLADLYVKCARYEEAEPLHRESVAVHKRVMPAGFFGTGLALLGHGRSLVGLGRYAEAEPVLLEAHQVLDAALDATDDRVVKAVRALAELYTAWHEVEPDKGYNATAAAWRAKLADLEGSDPDEER